MKKIISLLLALLLLVALVGCGGNKAATNGNETGTIETTSKVSDKLETEAGKVEYIGIEKAKAALFSEKQENVWLVKFRFSSKTAEPAQFQKNFGLSFFQNGVELQNSISYSSGGGEQYELVSNFFLEVMDGGVIEFARIVQAKDNSPLKVFMESYGEDKTKVNFEAALESVEEASDETLSPEDVKAELQGVWTGNSGGTEVQFEFSGDNVNFSAAGLTNPGTYVINEENEIIEMKINASNGTVSVKVPYKVEEGKLKLLNDAKEEVFFKK